VECVCGAPSQPQRMSPSTIARGPGLVGRTQSVQSRQRLSAHIIVRLHIMQVDMYCPAWVGIASAAMLHTGVKLETFKRLTNRYLAVAH
jgi:hypothetical protein